MPRRRTSRVFQEFDWVRRYVAEDVDMKGYDVPPAPRPWTRSLVASLAVALTTPVASPGADAGAPVPPNRSLPTRYLLPPVNIIQNSVKLYLLKINLDSSSVLIWPKSLRHRSRGGERSGPLTAKIWWGTNVDAHPTFLLVMPICHDLCIWYRELIHVRYNCLFQSTIFTLNFSSLAVLKFKHSALFRQ